MALAVHHVDSKSMKGDTMIAGSLQNRLCLPLKSRPRTPLGTSWEALVISQTVYHT